MAARSSNNPAKNTRGLCTQARRHALLSGASQFHACWRIVCCTISSVVAAQGLATDSAYLAVVVPARSVERREAHGRVHAGRVVAHCPDSVRRPSTPSLAPMAVVERALRNHCTLLGILAGMSVVDMADSVKDDEAVAGVAQQHDAGRLHRTQVAVTSSAHRKRGAHGWSLETHSWRGWPTPAHSPIRPPPSTRRVLPAGDVAAKPRRYRRPPML
ncbi:unnamed protein product [Arctia plantaginis]|uniref:Uncharacterized protein n=1 Tax=Arctia plantaginis TaxID=874455 RepID=A0A8S0ZYS3_ARCPL|nr:unnamed protein product [Arctia plantaginis]